MTTRLIESGADLDIKNDDEITPLIAAVQGGDLNVFQEILAHPEWDTELMAQRDNEGNTALMLTSQRGYTAIVQTILASSHCTPELLSHQNKDGKSTLHS